MFANRPLALLRIAATLALLSSGAARAEDPPKADPGAAAPAPKVDLTVVPPAAPAEAKPGVSAAVPPLLEPAAPPANHWLAVGETVGVQLTLNLGGRILKPEETSYDFTLETWKDNLGGPWEYDPNAFATNQFAHPYQGSLSMTASRSLGVGFWESAAYTALGSWIWEIFMEIHPPSVNDQITTTVGGAFLGEALFRLSSRIIDDGGEGKLDFWREFSAAAVAPMHGFNRLVFDDKHRDRRLKAYPISGELGVIAGIAGKDDSQGNGLQDLTEGSIRFYGQVTHGLPTEEGWRFRRPFDHFDLRTSMNIDRNAFTARSGVNLLIRGLLLGDDYGKGGTSGLWGMWGAYDVITAGELRASTSALALGTTLQWAPAPSLRFQGTGYLGVGFGAAGTNVEVEGKRDYHFGAQAIGLLETKLLWGNRARFRFNVREYVTGDQLSPDQGGYEDITYAQSDLLFRIWGRHSLGVELLGIRRQASYEGVPDVSQRFRQFSVLYAFVTEPSMGTGRAMYW